jgi:type I restriction enzyme S subunit
MGEQTQSQKATLAVVHRQIFGQLAVLKQRREKTRALKQVMTQELLTGRTRLV